MLIQEGGVGKDVIQGFIEEQLENLIRTTLYYCLAIALLHYICGTTDLQSFQTW